MSDREIRTGLRALKSSGRAVKWLRELIQELGPEDVYALMRFTRFWKERNEQRHRLGREYVAVKFLSDKYLKEFLLERRAKARLSGASSDDYRDDYGWRLYYKNNHRDDSDLVIEEANHRGFFASIQIEEQRAAMGDPVAVAKTMVKKLKRTVRGIDCVERSHDWERNRFGFICLNCRRKVSDEEVISGKLNIP